MAKYGRFDPRNKKKKNDKYRSEKKKLRVSDLEENTKNNSYSNDVQKELEKYNYR